ncbi:MAG: tripartite tricarboxylate transporter TctB family protein [Desulfobacterales bacterium]|nr:tripartite tricarboxylate transporter TctB family protein [Desulfobacterales bacterium]
MDRRKIDVVLSSILITVSMIILTNDNMASGGMETELGSMFLPRLISVFIIIFSGTMGAQALLKLRRQAALSDTEFIDTTGFMGVGIYFGIFILYWIAVPRIGFLASTPFTVLAVGYLLGGRSWIPMIVTAVLISVFIYYGCSQYLRVFLPTWSL